MFYVKRNGMKSPPVFLLARHFLYYPFYRPRMIPVIRAWSLRSPELFQSVGIMRGQFVRGMIVGVNARRLRFRQLFHAGRGTGDMVWIAAVRCSRGVRRQKIHRTSHWRLGMCRDNSNITKYHYQCTATCLWPWSVQWWGLVGVLWRHETGKLG